MVTRSLDDVSPAVPVEPPAVPVAEVRRAAPPRRTGVLRYVLGRLLWLVGTLAVTSVLVFVATQALPGDPARAILGRSASPEKVAALRAELGLDQSLLRQYWDWLSGVLTGDFGLSLASREPVTTAIGTKLTNSIVLVAVTTVIAVPLSTAVGALAAVRPGGWLDRVVNVVSLVLAALPEFVVGIAVIALLATGVMHAFPATSIVYGGGVLTDPVVLVLPTLTLVLIVFPYLMRLVRASMTEVLDSDYIFTARLRGIGGGRLLFRHALPNVAGPVIQALVIVLVYLISGVVLVEAVFGYPGIGLALVEAVRLRDLPVIQALAIGIAAFYLCLNLVADLATMALTPKMRAAR